MKNLLMAIALSLSIVPGAAQTMSLEEALASVEHNNPALRSQRELKDAQTYGARAANSIEDPRVSYSHTWGRGGNGDTGEAELTQAFDFPSSYLLRRRLAGIRAQQYGYQYETARRDVLLEAKLIYMEIQQCMRLGELYGQRHDDAQRASRAYARMVERGEVSVMQKNKMDHEKVSSWNSLKMNEIRMSALEGRLREMNGGVGIGVPDGDMVFVESVGPYDSTLKLMLEQDPSLLALLSGRSAAEQEVRVSRSLSLPKMELGYKYEFRVGERADGLVAGLSIPMFGNRCNVKRAKAEARYAQARVAEAEMSLETALRELYMQHGVLSGTVEEYLELGRGTDNIAVYHKALEAGEISVVEFYSETGSVYKMREEHIEALYGLRRISARINVLDL